jgi:heptosyltransferase-2
LDSIPSKILIRTPNWLGDLVMSTGFLRAVLETFPDSQVDIILKSGFEPLPIPHRGEIILFDKNRDSAGKFGKSLRHNNYDYFYVLPPSFSSAWMAFQSKIPKRIGYAGEYRSFLLTSAKIHEMRPGSQHLLKEYLDLLSNDLEMGNYAPRLEVKHDWVKEQLDSCAFKIPEKFVVFTPGAIYGPSKQWPMEHFRELAKQLHKAFGYKILLLGTIDDVESGKIIAHKHDWIHNNCGKTTLAQLLAILTKTQLLVGNDSGSMHLMAALQRPQIAVFGSTSPTWTGPINANATVMSSNLTCSPCFSRTCRFGHYDCLTQINPENILAEVQKHLSKVY